MIISEILTAATIPSQEARFPDPPDQTYAIWFDETTADGPDLATRIFTHDSMVELYEPALDDAAETRLETELNKRGIHWTKTARNWLQSVRRYQVAYDFTIITKT